MFTYKSLEKNCKKYQSYEKYVYKRCNNGCGLPRFWLVIMEKCGRTITNEDRKDVVDKKYAKFRANKLKVVKIINTIDGSSEDHVVNVSAYGDPLLYKVGAIVECDKFDKNIDVVCSHGIHYFKTLIPAYHYEMPNIDSKYNGEILKWYDNGRLASKMICSNGLSTYSWTGWDENGQKNGECSYKNGEKELQKTDYGQKVRIIDEVFSLPKN